MSKRKTPTHRLIWDYLGVRRRVTCISCQSIPDTDHTIIRPYMLDQPRWEEMLERFYDKHPSGTEVVIEGEWKKEQAIR